MGASSSPRRPPAARHVLLSAIAVAGSLTAAYVVQGIGGWTSATPTTVQAAPLPGTAALSGTVESTAPFKAAQVCIRNVDKRMLYMVYTQAGQFRAVNLFPGNYEINVTTKGLESDVQKLVLKAGTNPKVTLSLRASNEKPEMLEQSYDEIYPPGPGRDVAERTCIVCHGENFLPSRPTDAAGWNTRIDRMMGKALSNARPPPTPRGSSAIGIQRCVSRCRTAKTCLRTWSRTSASAPSRARSASSRKCRSTKPSSARRCTSSTT